ncbi:hypothetical protein K469DRAFT_664119 [Zopfia rhizophila CBS 207.26]|uniref:DUF7053 domain-containing protein n=1 Tax=Zopfia rhizophila CBS 207.26 TaxID=1314779 RepID=A0A6A6E6P1_9PEZI|nr:hypothetical protein K469DRAFT_664119 [Zopfia rhizophila CBS 207.26]
MTLAKHHLHVAALIPSHLSREDIVAALHDHNTCLTLQALTTRHKKLPETAPETKKDPYWYPVDLNPITTYEVTEGVTVIPGIGEWGKKYITFPSCFQDTPHGIKTRADTSGVMLRAEFRVIPGGADDGEVDGEGEGVGYADWVLVEDVEVQCAWYMMPFVRKSMEGAHRDICRKVVEKVEMLKMQEVVARSAAKGKSKVDQTTSPDKALPDLPDKITYG